MKIRALLFVVATASAAPLAGADAILLADLKRLDVSAVGNWGAPFNFHKWDEDASGVDYWNQLILGVSSKYGNADAYSAFDIDYLPANPGLGGAFGGLSLFGSIDVSAGELFSMQTSVDATARYELEFDLDALTDWSIEGNSTGHPFRGSGSCRLNLVSLSSPATIFTFERSGAFNEGFSASGQMAAGRYRLELLLEANATIPPTKLAQMGVTHGFTFVIPAPASAVLLLAAAVMSGRRRAR